MSGIEQGNEDRLNILLYPNQEKKEWRYRNKGKELDWSPYWNNFSSLI